MQPVWLFLLGSLIFLFPTNSELALQPTACDAIEDTFAKHLNEGEIPACRCFLESYTYEPYISCNGQKMPSVFDSLKELNDTLVSRLHISDCHITIIPNDMFDKVRPRSLTIENSGLALFRDGAFAHFGTGLKELLLGGNIFKKIDANMLSDVPRLQTLDLHSNRLSFLGANDLANVSELISLSLSYNEIESIEEGAFRHVPNLKELYLMENKLTAITRATFKGLRKLETLDLRNNDIKSIDAEAFADMKNLKYLSLSNNHISGLVLRGLSSLETLLLMNNSIQSLKHLTLKNLPSLGVLLLDRNGIREVEENDFFHLSVSTKLVTLSLASNQISTIHPRAFSTIGSSLIALALVNNQLDSLSSPDSQQWLRPLKRLQRLLLSHNSIGLLRNGELPTSLTHISLSHNKLKEVEDKALEGISPHRIFLHNNKLQFLPSGLFNSFNNDTFIAFDISSNEWICLCDQDWLSDWMQLHQEKDISEKRSANGCLLKNSCDPTRSRIKESSYWVTAVAAVLASASLLVLLAIAWLFVEDSKSGRPSIFNCCYTICPEERDSDRRRLIDDREIPEKAPLPLKSCLISGGARGEKKSVSIDGCKFPEKVSLASQQRRNVG